MVAIIGRSGSGKSTLLHILGCLDQVSQGNYYLDNIQVDSISNKEKARLRNEKIGFILQDFGLIPDNTVLESVMLPMMFDNTRFSEMEERAKEKLKMVGMEKQSTSMVSNLSGGEKQRTAIARALVKNPDYILADEPTGALDQKTGEDIVGIFKRLNQEGKTVIIVTHDPKVAGVCNRIVKISDGEIC